ncbi:hypothetical protein CSB69_3488 [Morganella morganii]|nr:hypothetical protein CSB69_3488 [Morganella morganii]
MSVSGRFDMPQSFDYYRRAHNRLLLSALSFFMFNTFTVS